MEHNKMRQAWCDESRWDFADLRVLFVNTTFKKPPEPSCTGLWQSGKTNLHKNRLVRKT